MFEVGAQLGFNYDVTNLVEMVENVTGVNVAEPAHPNVCFGLIDHCIYIICSQLLILEPIVF